MSYVAKADNITVVRGEDVILDDVSLHVASHDFITILGPNGAGKSVLLKVLMGLEKPNEGSISTKPNLRVGYVPQRLLPNPSMPLQVKRFLTVAQKVTSEQLNSISEETNIIALLNKPLYSLSGGELQRVLLARALLGNPELLVLDEPAQNLDIAGQLSFYKLLDKVYNERKIAILMVSHDLHMVMASTKQVICLYKHICCSGTPQIVAKDPEFKKLFGEDMASFMAAYQHSHDHSHDHVHDEDGGCSHG